MATYASDADVRLALGNLGNRLPPELNVPGHLDMAHATVTDRLMDAYSPGAVPEFTGPGLDVVRWAEARLAAADILDILRASTNADSPVAGTLRETAYASLDRGVPGFRPGGATSSGGPQPVASLPVSSTIATVTVFPDPYGNVPNVWVAARGPVPPLAQFTALIPVAITQQAYDDLVLAGADDARFLYVITE